MAKGLRSKDKRANRSSLREKITLPAIAARQEIISKRIADGLKVATGKSIKNLKNVLLKSNSSPSDMNADEANDDNQATEPEVELSAGQNIASTKKGISRSMYAQGLKVSPDFLSTRKKGSKPRINPDKELVWFK